MKILPDLSPLARRAFAQDVTRRSLGHFHAEAFRILHGGEEISPGNHIDAMVHCLEQLASGKIRKLIITLPPRHGKSELVSGAFPAWVLGNDPSSKLTIVSYGSELSNSLFNNVRTIVKDDRYRRLFPDVLIRKGQDRADHFVTAGGGGVRATSKAGAMTGLGTHFLIVDDFHKANESMSAVERDNAIETFRTTFFNRFDNLNDSRIVIVMQRIHDNDLVGWALRTPGWHHLNLPAYAVEDEVIPISRGRVWHRRKGDVLAPLLISAEELERKRAEMGERGFGAQFQQDPTIAEGALIDWNWFGQYGVRPPRGFFHRIVQSWDPATSDRITSDYSAGLTWGYRDGEWYLLDVIRAQLRFNELTDRVIAWHKFWRADALVIEGASIGISLYQVVKKARLPGIIRAPTPKGSKEDRLAKATVQLQAGNFLLPEAAPWLEALRKELLGFPDATNDDQVDALSQFVEFAFQTEAWVRAEHDRSGRKMNVTRTERRPRYYDGDVPSPGSSYPPAE
ncbi:phage terminase large subunit [Sphingomonas endolithica]|uniref:phage terminase large subunit n=1 Tax=Sphingomonas endolithica TaxID=2972485 RepID=UPI0021AFF40D|nr:phage terminase large subunit [Sphingomonas sp. ZFBP2030]